MTLTVVERLKVKGQTMEGSKQKHYAQSFACPKRLEVTIHFSIVDDDITMHVVTKKHFSKFLDVLNNRFGMLRKP